MKAVVAQMASRPAAAPCRAAPAPRRSAGLRAAARPLVRVHGLGKYLSEAASQIFSPKNDTVPWEANSQNFTGKIVHHEEAARIKALQLAVDSAVEELATDLSKAPAEDAAAYKMDEKVEEEGSMGAVVKSTIERVFNNNFTGDDTEPKKWISTGYVSAGRPRNQRELRHEYDRLARFQKVVKKVAAEVEAQKV